MAGNERWKYLVAEIKATSVFSTTIRTDALQTELDRHGAQGWELVSVLPQSHPVGMRLSFKRPG
jgi:hypothetical protein